MIAIKLVEASELPALCVNCFKFMDDLCLSFPAVYDVEQRGYLCEVCAQEISPAVVAMFSLVIAGALYSYRVVSESEEMDAQGEWVKEWCMRLYRDHFQYVFGQPEPDCFLTSEATQ